LLLPLGDLAPHVEKGLSGTGCLEMAIHFSQNPPSDIPRRTLRLRKGPALVWGQVGPDFEGFLYGMEHGE
ncbi:MAG: hypothetical protein RLZZ627_1332, partial [Pseudomonadota bacterium]